MYLQEILYALLAFPVLALFVTVPYVLHQYKKYGAIPFIRVVIVYSFILYLLVAFFLVMLPLPSQEFVNNLTTPWVQLIPFSFIKDIITQVPLTWNFYKYQEVYQVLFNIVLTIPFGVYLRYYFKCNLKKTILWTFLLSLFFELTQLSGLYFIYSRPYRLFDVDDLMLNTLGGLIGYAVTKVFTFWLPTRDEIEEDSYEKGMKVSTTKRLTALILDYIYIILLHMPLSIIPVLFKIKLNGTQLTIIVLLIYYVLIPTIKKGYTWGKKTCNLKIVDVSGNDCKWYQYLIRYFMLYFFIWGFPKLFELVVGSTIKVTDIWPKEYLFALYVVYLTSLVLILLFIFINNVIKKKPFLYEKISKTKLVSTIKIPEEYLDEE